MSERDILAVCGRWPQVRDHWIKFRKDSEIAALADQIATDAAYDENEGDRTETRQALEWLHSRGERGEEWGIVGRAAERIGLRNA